FQPELFVAQERMVLSSAPAWDGRGLTPRPVSLRAYLVATEDSYSVMPGGLTHVGAAIGGRRVSMRPDSSNKDTWVMANGPVEQVSLLNLGSQSVELRRVGNNLPSRLADNFFW